MQKNSFAKLIYGFYVSKKRCPLERSALFLLYMIIAKGLMQKGRKGVGGIGFTLSFLPAAMGDAEQTSLEEILPFERLGPACFTGSAIFMDVPE